MCLLDLPQQMVGCRCFSLFAVRTFSFMPIPGASCAPGHSLMKVVSTLVDIPIICRKLVITDLIDIVESRLYEIFHIVLEWSLNLVNIVCYRNYLMYRKNNKRLTSTKQTLKTSMLEFLYYYLIYFCNWAYWIFWEADG